VAVVVKEHSITLGSFPQMLAALVELVSGRVKQLPVNGPRLQGGVLGLITERQNERERERER
jgi:hypothetical protein